MASAPDFDPNEFNRYPADSRRNRAIADAYEPGSTFKIVTGALALDQGLIRLDEIIDTGDGTIRVANTTIQEADHHRYGALTLAGIFEHSSNIGIIRVGMRLGAGRLHDGAERLGVGRPTGVDLPGENSGIFRPLPRWSGLSTASISMGQEVSLNALQLARITAVAANGGYLVEPHLVTRVVEPGGRVRAVPVAERVRVLSPQTARAISKILVGVVEHGTGAKAAVPGFAVAGKTGTAQKAGFGGYQAGRPRPQLRRLRSRGQSPLRRGRRASRSRRASTTRPTSRPRSSRASWHRRWGSSASRPRTSAFPNRVLADAAPAPAPSGGPRYRAGIEPAAARLSGPTLAADPETHAERARLLGARGRRRFRERRRPRPAAGKRIRRRSGPSCGLAPSGGRRADSVSRRQRGCAGPGGRAPRGGSAAASAGSVKLMDLVAVLPGADVTPGARAVAPERRTSSRRLPCRRATPARSGRAISSWRSAASRPTASSTCPRLSRAEPSASSPTAPRRRASRAPWIRWTSARRALALLAAELHGHPAEKLVLAAVTGTNGKTSTTTLVEAILARRYGETGLLATIGVPHAPPHDSGRPHDSRGDAHPGAPRGARRRRRPGGGDRGLLARARPRPRDGLPLRRRRLHEPDARPPRLPRHDGGVLRGEEASLFDAQARGRRGRQRRRPLRPAPARGDRRRPSRASRRPARRTRTFGRRRSAAIWAAPRFDVVHSGGRFAVASPLLGRFQVGNVLGAAAAGIGLGVPEDDVAAAIAGVANVPGRLERVEAGQAYPILVDYAHTPDALERLLSSVRELTDKQIILVFGCGGDRDRGKRAPMGEIAGRRADIAIATSDNPALRGSGGDPARGRGGPGALRSDQVPQDRRAAGCHPRRRRAREPGIGRRDRRQGARDHAVDRGAGAALRRPESRGGARGREPRANACTPARGKP